MFEFNPDENFWPSQSTKRAWMYTHKTVRTFAAVPLPGLFATTTFIWRILGVIGIFILESIATYYSYWQGVNITAIIGSIVVDFVLAVLSHLPWQQKICECKNKLVYEEDVTAKKTARRLSRYKMLQRFLYLFIVCSAFFKFYWFYSVYGIPNTTSGLIFTCYMIGAMLHCSCTGYAIFTIIFELQISKEHTAYIESEAKEFAYDSSNPLRIDLGDREFKALEVGNHKIVMETKERAGGGGTEKRYWLETLGVLTDKELSEFISRQDTREQKRDLAVKGVEHQMAILDVEPTAKKTI
ncbi:MAG TPA: hypothetical protein VLX91_04030 [Candidatus Acidoferrales bacterium]|nr:hypothetical protein [Candidatus Acidoferrales bacterium]